MRLTTWHKLQLREALDAPDTPSNSDAADQHYHDYGGDQDSAMPKQPLSAPPPGLYEMEQNGDLFLIHRKAHYALVVDQRQHYHLVHFKKRKQWWKGPRKYLGPIGREKALQALDKVA